MNLRRVRLAQEKDTELLTVLYERLNTCNANPSLVDSAIAETQSAFSGEFKRITLIAEELVGSEFQPQATASFFTPPADSADFAYYSHLPEKLVLSSRPNNFIEFGGLVQLPETKGYSHLLTPVRALFIRWMREKQIVSQDEVLVELLPQKAELNTFWHKIVFPAFRATNYEALCRELSVGQADLFSTLSQLSFSDRNSVVHRYFPTEINTYDLDPSDFSSVASPAALTALQQIYNLRIIGYFPVDGGQNWIDKSQNGLPGQTETTLQVVPDDKFHFSHLHPKIQHALVYDPANPFKVYSTPGVWGEQVAVIPSTTAKYLELSSGSQIGYRTIR